MPSIAHHIVIVGCGFAGTATARALDALRWPGLEITLISDESYTTFNPLLPEAVGASVFPEQVVAPLREVLDTRRGDRFVMGRVTQVDTVTRTLRCETLGGPREIAWDQLVLAFGNRARLDLVPGMALHALPLKTVGDALHIRNVVLRRIARIELETDPALRRELGHFVVVGGGFSGVEVAGELADTLRSIRRYYPRVAADELGVTLLHDQDRLLPELPPALGTAAARSLLQRGVRLLLRTRAVAVSERQVLLTSAATTEVRSESRPGPEPRPLAARTVICTIGTRPNALVQQLGWPLERGRLVVNADLAVPLPGATPVASAGPQAARVWALGDCAWVVNGRDGRPCPTTAQFAVRQARVLAGNLRAAHRGEPTRAFAATSIGMMAATGRLAGVAQVLGFTFSGWPAWLLWRAYYLSQMPTLRRRLRLFVEWTWGMFFPADITHLRFTRSAELQAEEGPR